MLRNFALATAAIASLALGAVISSPASARGPGHHGYYNHSYRGHWGGPRFVYRPHYRPYRPYAFAYGPCIRTRWVPTPWGPRLRRVNVCY